MRRGVRLEIEGGDMGRPRVRSARQPQTVQEWMDGELRTDAELRREVEETLSRMRIEPRFGHTA